jgi:hypothetical protein
MTDLAGRGALGSPDPCVGFGQRSAGEWSERFSGGAEANLAACPMEKSCAGKRLQPLDLLAECRLGDVQLRSGSAEVELVCNRKEVPKMS